MRKNLEREVTAALLAGGSGSEPMEALIRKGLSNYRDVRSSLVANGLTEAVRNLRSSKAGRDYVRVQLRRGAVLKIHLSPRSWYRDGTFDSKPMPLVTLELASGGVRKHMDAGPAAQKLARRAGTDVEVAVRIVLGIERARRRCYELCEEATRWL